MFFIISKLLLFLIKPINWVLFLLLYALFSKKRNRKRKAVVIAVVMTLFFSNRFIFNQFAKIWEVKTITADEIIRPYKVGILLGGYSNGHIVPRHERHNFSFVSNRFINTYELYRTGKIEKILLTGGSGDVLKDQPPEAPMVAEFLKRIGVPEKDIIVEGESRNTYENAIFTKNILQQKNIRGNYLLITSAWHIRRAQGCFEKAGVSFTPYSVDFFSEADRWHPENTIFTCSEGFYLWEKMMKEWVGYAVYWMQGYL